MPQVGFFAAKFLVGGLGLTGFGATLAFSAVKLGVGLALSSALSPRGEDNAGTAPDGRVLSTNPVTPRVRLYGDVLRQGQLMFQRAAGGYLHRVIAHGQGPVERFVELRLAGKPVGVDDSGRVLAPPYDHGDAGSLVRIEQRVGAEGQVAFLGPADVAPEWGAAHRLAGVACTWVRFQQRDQNNHLEAYPQGVPALECLIEGARDIFDPRDSAQRFTRNAGLIIADWIEHPDGFGRAGALHVPDVIAAANAADAARPLASGGSVPSWRICGAASLADSPGRVLGQMLDACGGDLRLRPDGKIGLVIGGDPAPVVTLTEDDLLGLESLDDGADALSRYTDLPITYRDRDALDHIKTTAAPWVNAAEVARLGETVQGATFDLEFAPGHAQARHAGKIKSLRDNPPQMARLIFKASALHAVFERTVTLDMPRLGLSGAWRVMPWQIGLADEAMTVTLDLAQIEPDAQAWSVAEEGAAQVLPPAQEDAEGPVAAPGDVQAAGHADGSADAGIFVVFSAPVASGVGHYVAIRTSPSGAWQAVATTADATSVQIAGLSDGVEYDVAVIAARSPIYDPTDPDGTDVIIPAVTASALVPVPAVPTSLSVSDSGQGVALVTVTASADAVGRWTDILRDGAQVARRRTVPGEVITVGDPTGAGAFTWAARAVSLSGETSAPTGGVTVAIA